MRQQVRGSELPLRFARQRRVESILSAKAGIHVLVQFAIFTVARRPASTTYFHRLLC